VWRDIVAAFPHSVIEFFVRAVKDILADTNEHGKLSYIIREKKAASFALYAAFLDGLRKMLFQEIAEAFKGFQSTHHWEPVEEARLKGYRAARAHAEAITEIYRSGKEDMAWVAKEIEKTVLGPWASSNGKVRRGNRGKEGELCRKNRESTSRFTCRL